MDKIARIRQEIERYIKHYEKLERNDFQNGELYICQELLSFLDTLSEEPDKSLEEAANDYCSLYYDWDNEQERKSVVATFIAGAEWQKQQMLKDAMEADVNTYKDLVLNCGWVEFVVDMPSSETDKFGDKVRIVVLKEEED